MLLEDDDFRVRALTDAEPETTPLGPFAVVDILKGTAPTVAAQRQSCGYYDVARELAYVREEKTPKPTPAADPSFALPAAKPAESSGKAKKASKAEEAATVQERIAPKKRSTLVDEETTAPSEQELQALDDGPSFLRRDLPRPRGRFTRVEAPRTPFVELTRAGGKELLEASLEGSEHRFALLRNMSHRFNGSRGDLTLVDLETVLRDHGLLDALKEKERLQVLDAYTQQRGATGRVGWALGVSPPELARLVASVGLSEDVEALRERFRREALATSHLTHRLDLLGREKYLADLGIQRKFNESLRKDLERLLRDELPGATDLHGLCDSVGRKYGSPAELIFRAIERLGLAEGLRKQLYPGAPPSTP
ncbi:hypothetical protein [Myxococcus qinghaiensis]|uniref:hypothetical protein n=1 Tax=Myxococcus qinghaiensis TaxID=2906758 RepID=UPI002B20F1B5|nr:hypothetical protein [Myxococcus qinghaiensis]